MNRPMWVWEMLGPDDAVLDRPLSPTFTNRFDAEAWLGEHWRELAAEGVVAARLQHQGSPIAPAVPLSKG